MAAEPASLRRRARRTGLLALAALATVAATASAGGALAGPGSAAASTMALTSRHGRADVPARGADGPPQPRRESCSGLDAENSPACAAGRNAPASAGALAPETGAASPSGGTGSDQSAAAASRASAPPARPRKPAAAPARAASPPPFGLPPMVLAAAAGATALLATVLAVGLWRLRRRKPEANAPRATRPTPYRRDLILSDEDGRGWRIPGDALFPGVFVGADHRSLGYVNGRQVEQRHVEFWVCDGRLLVRRCCDAPTFLNDRSLSPAECSIVSTGDRMRLGQSEFTVLID
jgi:hypothetical protein